MTTGFELDLRLELLAALVMLARPRERERCFKVSRPYTEAVLERFGPLSRHPAAAELARLLERGVSESHFTEMILLQTDARKLELGPEWSGGNEELADFFVKLRDFAARSDYEAFFRSRKRGHGEFLAIARAETARAQKSKTVSAYLRMPFGRCRFVLAPLLPASFAVNMARDGINLRVRGGYPGKGQPAFEYDNFSSSVAHELTHTVVTPLIQGSRSIFDARRGGPPAGCRDSGSWSGCVEEHIVYAVTLRALAVSDEKGFSKLMREIAATGYPFLEELCSRLRGFEASSVDFAAYYPRLIRELLGWMK